MGAVCCSHAGWRSNLQGSHGICAGRITKPYGIQMRYIVQTAREAAEVLDCRVTSDETGGGMLNKADGHGLSPLTGCEACGASISSSSGPSAACAANIAAKDRSPSSPRSASALSSSGGASTPSCTQIGHSAVEVDQVAPSAETCAPSSEAHAELGMSQEGGGSPPTFLPMRERHCRQNRRRSYTAQHQLGPGHPGDTFQNVNGIDRDASAAPQHDHRFVG